MTLDQSLGSLWAELAELAEQRNSLSGERMRLSHLDTYLSSRMHIKDTKYGEFSSQCLAGSGGCSK